MLGDDASWLDQMVYTQPGLFTLEVALYRMFEAWGLPVDVMLGHSTGELAAAHVAGVFDLDDACKLVAARGRLMQALPPGGAMVSIQAGEDDVAPLLAEREGVDIAALNSPTSTVISGDEAPVLELAAEFERRGFKTKRLAVSIAAHSRCVEPMLDEFARVASSITYAQAKIPIVSAALGRLAEQGELSTPDYWVRHLRTSVRFLDGVRALEKRGVDVCLELGPHGMLSSMMADCLSSEARSEVALVAALRRDRPETMMVALALAGLHGRGISIDWEAYFAPFDPRVVELPTYPFQRARYWLEAPATRGRDLGAAGLEVIDHPLLGAMLRLADRDAYVFTARLDVATTPWLAEHRVFGQVLFPASGMLDFALAAAVQVGATTITELAIDAPLVLSDGATDIQLSIGEPDDPDESWPSSESPFTRAARARIPTQPGRSTRAAGRPRTRPS